MAKKNNNTGLLIGIAIIIAAVIIAPQLNFNFSTVNQETINQLENIPEGTCSISLSENVIYAGDTITGTVKDGANTLCNIYGNLDSAGWIKIAEGVTSSNGQLIITDDLYVAGALEFRAICGDCVTNKVYLVVNPVETLDCTDSDGNNKDTPGWVIDDGVTYYDECIGEGAVKEYTCVDGSVFNYDVMCDVGSTCFATRSGGYCMLDDEGLQPGDEVGSWEENHLMSNSDTSFEMELTAGDEEVQLCAEIERSSYKADPMCNPQGSLEDWAEFVFLDSTGVVWDRSDQIMSGMVGGPDTFGNPDVLHVYWDGQTNFKGYMSHYGPCPMNMKLKITLVVCE